jgi:hypothetical protein
MVTKWTRWEWLVWRLRVLFSRNEEDSGKKLLLMTYSKLEEIEKLFERGKFEENDKKDKNVNE